MVDGGGSVGHVPLVTRSLLYTVRIEAGENFQRLRVVDGALRMEETVGVALHQTFLLRGAHEAAEPIGTPDIGETVERAGGNDVFPRQVQNDLHELRPVERAGRGKGAIGVATYRAGIGEHADARGIGHGKGGVFVGVTAFRELDGSEDRGGEKESCKSGEEAFHRLSMLPETRRNEPCACM